MGMANRLWAGHVDSALPLEFSNVWHGVGKLPLRRTKIHRFFPKLQIRSHHATPDWFLVGGSDFAKDQERRHVGRLWRHHRSCWPRLAEAAPELELHVGRPGRRRQDQGAHRHPPEARHDAERPDHHRPRRGDAPARGLLDGCVVRAAAAVRCASGGGASPAAPLLPPRLRRSGGADLHAVAGQAG